MQDRMISYGIKLSRQKAIWTDVSCLGDFCFGRKAEWVSNVTGSFLGKLIIAV